MATVQPHSLTLPYDWLCVFVCVTRGTRGDRLLGQVEVQRRRGRGGGRRRAQWEQERPTVRRAVPPTPTGDTDPHKYLMCSYGRVHTGAALSCGKHKMCPLFCYGGFPSAETDTWPTVFSRDVTIPEILYSIPIPVKFHNSRYPIRYQGNKQKQKQWIRCRLTST